MSPDVPHSLFECSQALVLEINCRLSLSDEDEALRTCLGLLSPDESQLTRCRENRAEICNPLSAALLAFRTAPRKDSTGLKRSGSSF